MTGTLPDGPVLVAAFEGWNDAASAASDAARFLIRTCHATEIWQADADEYFDFQAARPIVELVDGVTRSLRWPTIAVHRGRSPRTGRELVIALGPEPNLHWQLLCHEILESAGTEFAACVTLGALLGDAPHTRPLPITGAVSDPALGELLGMRRSRYEGPTGIVGVFADHCRRAGNTTASLWVPVPHYVATPPCPKATHALLERLDTLTGLELDLRNLEIAARGWVANVDAAMETDGDLVAYVHGLEARHDSGEPDTWGTDDWDEDDDEFEDSFVDFDDEDDDWDDDEFDEDELPSGDTLAADFERFLREQGDD